MFRKFTDKQLQSVCSTAGTLTSAVLYCLLLTYYLLTCSVLTVHVVNFLGCHLRRFMAAARHTHYIIQPARYVANTINRQRL